jgi:hypothetical protein
MTYQNFAKHKTAFFIIAAIILLLEIPGALDIRNVPSNGLWWNRNNKVVKVFPNSPAQDAGFMVGDSVISSGGIDLTDSKALARRTRANIGETRTYVVQRSGDIVPLDLTFSGLSAKQIVLSFSGTIIGFCFLIFGLWPYLKIQNKKNTLLALLGIAVALAFMDYPYFTLHTLRKIFYSLLNIPVTFSLAFALHFMLAFPKEKPILEKKYILFAIYGPATFETLYILFLIILQPESTSALRTLSSIIFGLFFVGYIVLAVIAMAHSYIKASSVERKAQSLNFLLLGLIIGVCPLVVINIIYIFAPEFVFPGGEFYFLTLIIIPFALARAALGQQKQLV